MENQWSGESFSEYIKCHCLSKLNLKKVWNILQKNNHNYEGNHWIGNWGMFKSFLVWSWQQEKKKLKLK